MRAWLVVAGALVCGCAQGSPDDGGPPETDAGPAAEAGPPDAGRSDSGMGDAGLDAGASDAGPPMDAGPRPDAGRDAGPSVCDPSPTNMEISEVMVASQTGSGDRGEWFEVRNRTGCPIDLAGLVIDLGATHTVTSGLLTAGGFFVFAQSADADDNHGLGDDYIYGTALQMSNSGGSLTLTHGATEIARVGWGSTDHRSRSSRQLGLGASMSSSLGGTGWCDSTAVYSMSAGGPYLGTPGMVNATCP